MTIGVVLVLLLGAGIAAAAGARRLPARGAAALALTLLPPLGLYYLFGAC
jgi:hypothetical protein